MHKQGFMARAALISVLVMVALAVTACANLPPFQRGTPAAGETGAPPSTEISPTTVARPTEMPPAGSAASVDAAREALAQELNVQLEDVHLVSVGPVDWPNGCLGIEKPGVICTQVIVPGYQIILEVNGKRYEYRSDLAGNQVVRGPEEADEGATPETATPAAALRVQTAAAEELGVEPAAVRIVSAEKIDWPDPCLGVPDPLELCAQVITPGYRVVLEANGQQVIYHTDETGQTIRRGRQPGTETPAATGTEQPAGSGEAAEGPIIGLRSDVNGCTDVRIDFDGVMFGACGEEMASSGFLADTFRLEQLTDMHHIYSSFGVSTLAGKVTFVGKGPIEATPVEQRMIAEWATLVAQEVKTGPGGAQYGLGWHREGGIAGFCDDIAVEVSGHAVWRSCKPGQETAARWRRLTSAELTIFYDWIDQLGQVEYEQKDPAVADAMTISGFLGGRGTGEGSEADKAAMVQFGSELLRQWAEATPVRLIDTLAEVNMRRGPTEQAAVIEKIAAGQQALVTGVNRDSTWWRVICPDDTVGHCWVSADATLTQPVVPAGSTGEAPVDETGILTAVIRQVYTVDDTFGGEGNFTTVYLLAVDDMEGGAIPYSNKARPVSEPVQQGVLAALTDLPSRFEWITTAGEAPRDENNTIEGNGAIITVGNIHAQPDGTVQVASSIYVGMLAAGGQTYVLERQDGVWKVTGNTGTIWIS